MPNPDLVAEMQAALAPTTMHSHPNLGELRIATREIGNLVLNVKSLGYDLARMFAERLPRRDGLAPYNISLCCKPCTQADMGSEWATYWLSELRTKVNFQRKLWEYAYLLQGLYEAGAIHPGAKGLGFGCGNEPIASYLASKSLRILVTDLESANPGSAPASIEAAFHPHLVNRNVFEDLVSHRFVDMNAIPADLQGFDFCWSLCALQQLGSIENSINFVVAAMTTLKPGGVAVHTTEFNFLDDENTLDNWQTVLLQRAHFERLSNELSALGHEVAPLDFNTGSKPIDHFIDMPPYAHDWSDALRKHFTDGGMHLKLSIDGFASTCFGLIVKRGR